MKLTRWKKLKRSRRAWARAAFKVWVKEELAPRLDALNHKDTNPVFIPRYQERPWF